MELARMTRALIAGTAGTWVVAALGPLEKRALGHEPPFAPDALARNLAAEHLHLALSDRAARAAGLALRAAYGPAWGLVLAAFPRALTRHPLLAGGLLGVLVEAFESRAFPLTGAASPERWSRRARSWLRIQALAFGLTSATVFAGIRP